ncbi:hypothetical protein DOY81_005254 [Sarcophaga bullata]|nr:hypothetical protein DOY81_005254 [Sarcophaga bullata]
MLDNERRDKDVHNEELIFLRKIYKIRFSVNIFCIKETEDIDPCLRNELNHSLFGLVNYKIIKCVLFPPSFGF